MLTRFREPVSGFTHLGGAVLAIPALIWLTYATHDEPAKMISMIVYGLSLIALYSASALMHLSFGSPRKLDRLRALDHAAINLLIAGTYTPFVYNVLTGSWRWGLLAAIWSLAVFGMAYKLLFADRYHGHLSTISYVAMGWLAVIVLPQAITLLPWGALVLIVGGGVVYSLGAVVFALRKPNLHPLFGAHELWHLFVLGGSLLHFIAVVIYVV